MAKNWFFGDYLQRVMDERGLEYQQVAKKADLTASYIHNLLRGHSTGSKADFPRISVDTLITLAKALGEPEIKLLLAYKGVDPDNPKEVESREGFNIYSVIEQAAEENELQMKTLSNKERIRLERYIVRSVHRFINTLMEREAEHLKGKKS